MQSHDDGFVPPARQGKPRKRGMTAVIDYGPDGFGWTGERGVADLLDCAAEYIDFAKIYAMNALLLPKPVVQRIVKLYRDSGVNCYSGGILFEYAYQRNEIDRFSSHLCSIGFTSLEISENYITLNDNERLSFIERFQRLGLSVIYEFGRKNPEQPMRMEELEGLVTSLTNRGVDHIIVEQSEIDMAAKSAPDLLKALAAAPWFERILIEADPYRYPKQHVGLLQDFGPDVNLANIAPGQALRLEGLRRGIGRAVNYSILAE
ncbi:phosphosulfolactate synthase (plasmid) [Bradyrhizobium sp. CCBAU 53351]|nr:phosphosulfolactate synthase [Bradyrhizobium guangdongense]QAU51194.1 phosphosulfolactate synthase [Bradyrhizobium guangzhouense]QOZ49830.1 phosphosulfolactate synthase [Bradyrhizobium sp. CCBAU 53340]QOZ57277.1 phosphosulfolactate synthase [Bradyrhizobium sp. CCBAU 53338]QOZ81525.1 phosphosulfolactate synthase [Bradyrhizobium sp. CCBAU 53351]